MKKYIFLWALIAVISCSPDNSIKSAKHDYVGIKKQDAVVTTKEDSGVPLKLNVYFGGEVTGNAATFDVPYTITGATYGTDYTVVGGSSASGMVTIPVGATGVALGTIQIMPVANVLVQSNKVLTVTLGTATKSGVSTGYPLYAAYNVTIVDDDCAYAEADYKDKTAQARETYSDGSCYPSCSTTYGVGVTVAVTNTLTLDNFWDSGWVLTMTVDPITKVVTIPSQSPAAGWTVDGSGTVDTCGKILTFDSHIVSTGGYNDTNSNIYKF